MDLPADWAEALAPWLDRRRLDEVCTAVATARRAATVYPPEHLVFEAFRRTPFAQVRVAIVGQDPYHGAGQACGLSFAVPPGVAPPPSLVNLFKELSADRGVPQPAHGWLGAWADRGVLLLNTVLTVREDEAASHHGIGWEVFTDAVLDALAARPAPVVFALLGGPARKKSARLHNRPVVEVAHPSPLSFAHFKGCRLFSQIDAALGAPLDWSLPSSPGLGPDLAPRGNAAVAGLGTRPDPDTLRHLLEHAVWERCTASERGVIAAAVASVLPRRFSWVGLKTFDVGATRREVAVYTFDDPDRGLRRFHLIPGGSAPLGRDPRKAKLSPAQRARFAGVARTAGWPEDVDAWVQAEIPPPRTVVLAPFLLEASAPLPAEQLPSPARDLDRHGQLAATLAIDGLRLPSPDELEWALAGAAPGLFPWGAAWPFTAARPPTSAFGIPWPSASWFTAEPGCARPAVGAPDDTTAGGWRAALSWCPAAFANAPLPDRVCRVRGVFPYDAR